jgi:hypothetical protein
MPTRPKTGLLLFFSGANDTTAPAVTGFAATSPSGLTIAITTFTADADAASFLITESSTPPLAGAVGWAGSAPTTFTASGTGTITLYPWVKDAAGNVSSVYGSPVAVTVVNFLDNFTGADGTNLTAHTPDIAPVGATWAKIGGSDVVISGNKAASITGSGFVYAIESGVSNFTLTVTVNATSSGYFGVVVRYSDTSNYWYLLWRKSDNTLQIYKREGGAGALMASVGKTLNLSQDYTMTVVCNEENIQMTMEGTTVSYSSAFNKTATKIGLWASVAGTWEAVTA